MVSNIIQLGDKVDISILQQVEQAENNGPAHVYKSNVHDINEDGELEITMPIENGKLVLLPLGVRYEFVFYTKGGLYRSVGQIKERFKRENIYVFLIELHTQLNKFQRREYYRYPCLLESQFFLIPEEKLNKKSTTAIFDEIRDDDFYNKQKKGITVDISGGGVRMITEQRLEVNSHILLVLNLTSETLDSQYLLVGQVLSSERSMEKNGVYESRIQFILKDPQVREEIIRYIFEEERKNRHMKKEK